MEWQYLGAAPKAGRKLLLIQEDEIPLVMPLLYRYMTKEYLRRKPDWFQCRLAPEQSLSQQALFIELNQHMRLLLEHRRQRNAEQLQQALILTNQGINQFFSDLGWRMVRREFSQIKKRQKKGHIEVSKDIIERLRLYMAQHQFDSFDDAIDNLLCIELEENFSE
ncbi:hypothetical protein [Shewanella sp. NIFS-20-20]|uniref:hypothetical protein n=1 Tax=Shewanella sp. NIFS-20-20 TaxID=2853806 RepID=UPI001C468CB4|nr:hypothetical protein [Shewanella sp. NIFS-20-20]MBV7316352.1 hypothetical protein [Shewanella sp. NIFS-20-20]